MHCNNCGNNVSSTDKYCSKCGNAITQDQDFVDESSQNGEESCFIPPLLELYSNNQESQANDCLRNNDETSYNTDINFSHYYRSATLNTILSAILILVVAVVGIYLVIARTGTVDYIKSIFTEESKTNAQTYDALPIKKITSDETRAPDAVSSYEPENLMKNTYGMGDNGTCWAYNYPTHPDGAMLTVTLTEKSTVHGIQIQNGYTKNKECYDKNRRVRKIQIETPEGIKQSFVLDKPLSYSESKEPKVLTLNEPIKTKVLKIYIIDTTEQIFDVDKEQDDVCISYLSVF